MAVLWDILPIFRRAGLVKGRRNGKWVHYRLHPAEFNPYAAPVLELLGGLLEDHPMVRRDREALRGAVRMSCLSSGEAEDEG